MAPKITPLVLAICLFVATASLSTANSLRGSEPRVRGTNQASSRLMKELVEIYKSDSYKNETIKVELEDDNLYEWNVKLFFQDPNCVMHKDLRRLKSKGGEDHVMIRISFGDDYPHTAPLVRVQYPVLDGAHYGVFCMHLLSPQGWFSACPTETLIMAIINFVVSSKYGVSFNGNSQVERENRYTPEKARESFNNMMKHHGWDKPRERID